ncbi:MAG: hypothetical protein HOP07_04710 [Bacteriovoracaceae bacterium]|nr:hypothetical protein [Bacteriovoracaceae bacterium]
MMIINCEVSLGELVDKLSILKIKSQKISDLEKLIHISKEAESLNKTLNGLNLDGIDFHLEQMIEINLKLWKIEDDIRDCEKNKIFDQVFIELARAVYVTNDERFKRKNVINMNYKSGLVEVKSYQNY